MRSRWWNYSIVREGVICGGGGRAGGGMRIGGNTSKAWWRGKSSPFVLPQPSPINRLQPALINYSLKICTRTLWYIWLIWEHCPHLLSLSVKFPTFYLPLRGPLFPTGDSTPSQRNEDIPSSLPTSPPKSSPSLPPPSLLPPPYFPLPTSPLPISSCLPPLPTSPPYIHLLTSPSLPSTSHSIPPLSPYLPPPYSPYPPPYLPLPTPPSLPPLHSQHSARKNKNKRTDSKSHYTHILVST